MSKVPPKNSQDFYKFLLGFVPRCIQGYASYSFKVLFRYSLTNSSRDSFSKLQVYFLKFIQKFFLEFFHKTFSDCFQRFSPRSSFGFFQSLIVDILEFLSGFFFQTVSGILAGIQPSVITAIPSSVPS